MRPDRSVTLSANVLDSISKFDPIQRKIIQRLLQDLPDHDSGGRAYPLPGEEFLLKLPQWEPRKVLRCWGITVLYRVHPKAFLIDDVEFDPQPPHGGARVRLPYLTASSDAFENAFLALLKVIIEHFVCKPRRKNIRNNFPVTMNLINTRHFSAEESLCSRQPPRTRLPRFNRGLIEVRELICEAMQKLTGTSNRSLRCGCIILDNLKCAL
jgi:hypothetical protein